MYFIPFFSFEKVGRETRRFYFLQNFFFTCAFFSLKTNLIFRFVGCLSFLFWPELKIIDYHDWKNWVRIGIGFGTTKFFFRVFLSSLIFVVYNGSRAAMQYQTVITIWYSGSTIAAWNFDLDHRLFPADDLCLVWVDFEPPEKIIGKIIFLVKLKLLTAKQYKIVGFWRFFCR